MPADLEPWFTDTFGELRLAAYRGAARHAGVSTLDLILWDIQVTEAFHTPLGMLEKSVRSALHQQLKARYQRPDWWESAPLTPHGMSKVNKAMSDARRELARRGLRTRPTADHTMGQLTFGFWVSLLSQQYDRPFWVPALHRAFPGYRGRRRDLHDNLEAMSYLRNRVMHHEPIHHRDLAADHAKIYRLIGYVQPDATVLLRQLDRVPEMLTSRPRRAHHAP